ncbi:hypothetical protein MMPV_002966 [Pyropia vietnamensis]
MASGSNIAATIDTAATGRRGYRDVPVSPPPPLSSTSARGAVPPAGDLVSRLAAMTTAGVPLPVALKPVLAGLPSTLGMNIAAAGTMEDGGERSVVPRAAAVATATAATTTAATTTAATAVATTGMDATDSTGMAPTPRPPPSVTLTMRVTPAHMAANGAVHGGAVVSLADTAAGAGTVAAAPPGVVTFSTLGLDASFVGTLRGDGGVLTAVAELVHGGRSTQVWMVGVWGEEGGGVDAPKGGQVEGGGGTRKQLAFVRVTQFLVRTDGKGGGGEPPSGGQR